MGIRPERSSGSFGFLAGAKVNSASWSFKFDVFGSHESTVEAEEPASGLTGVTSG